MIRISVNNVQQEVEAKTSILGFLEKINQPQKGIAIAINEEVVPKNDWPNKLLSENDHLLIIQATQGG